MFICHTINNITRTINNNNKVIDKKERMDVTIIIVGEDPKKPPGLQEYIYLGWPNQPTSGIMKKYLM